MPEPKQWNNLSVATTQVLLCDLQKEIVARSKTNAPDALSQSAAVLWEIAELFCLPIVLSVVPEGDKAPTLLAGLKKRARPEQQYLRASATPFSDAATLEKLASLQRNTIVLAGFATEVVVLHAALDAVQQGYQVLVAVDACGGMSDRTEAAAFEQMREAGVIVTSVVSIATALGPDFTTQQGRQMFGIVQQLRLA